MSFVLIVLMVLCGLYALVLAVLALRYKTESAVLPDAALPGVSVLIPARNEAETIAACLDAILACPYPAGSRELIVVDDDSTDATAEVLKPYADKGLIKLLKSGGAGKKMALQTAIEAAAHNLLLCTDADSLPARGWLRSMATAMKSKDLNMLCGPVSMVSGNTLFASLQQAESAAVVGLSTVLLNSGMPATCNGANLMFRKDVFEAIGGYGVHAGMSSGDDDLLMQQFYRQAPGKVYYLTDAQALVRTNPAGDLAAFFAQRLRWISKRPAYLYPYNSILQIMVSTQLAAFWILSVLWLFDGNSLAAALVLAKFASEVWFSRRIAGLLPHKLFTVFLMPVFQLYVFPLLLLSAGPKPMWKGRTIR